MSGGGGWGMGRACLLADGGALGRVGAAAGGRKKVAQRPLRSRLPVMVPVLCVFPDGGLCQRLGQGRHLTAPRPGGESALRQPLPTQLCQGRVEGL